jgi:hypothetical protein
MGFLANLADQISSQFSVGENTTTSLDAVVNGQNQKYGSLGDLASKFDQSAERRYVEEGFLRRDPYNSDPKLFEVLLQEPNATILVKKSMFSSINENYRPDYMDQDEKMYFKAMKVLFQNKCRQISNLEKLSKIQKVTAAVGNVSSQLMPLIISLTDGAGSGLEAGGPNLFGGSSGNGEVSNFTKVIERVRRIYGFGSTNDLTTWITDPTNLFQSQFGQGTGVIEITNFTTLNTTVTNNMTTPGGFGFTISDPYESMLITSWDIEKAISDATNAYYNHKVYQFGQDSASQVINDAQTRLSQIRAARGAGQIEIITAPNTVINKRVRAIIDATGDEIQFTYNAIGGINGSVTVAPEYLQGGAILGIQGLSTGNTKTGIGPNSNIRTLVGQSELSIFQQLITATFNQLMLQQNSQNAFQTSNKNTNYARRKLNFQFCGKLIIQPMDIVHIYINSKSRWDNKLLGGLQNMYTGNGILGNINNTLTDLANATSTLFNPSGNIQMQAEKSAYVGADFPNFLWALMRNQFVTEKEGTHVCAGLVDSAPSNWQDGKFIINVNGKDNTAYFDMGKVNWKPGVDVFNGPLFDPLTPFQTTFDTITSNAKSDSPILLPENQYLLGVSGSTATPLVKFKSGPNAGQAAFQDNIAQNYSIDQVTGAPGKVYYAPDGLVYKWKEGIGTLVQFGSSIDINDPSKVGNPAITKEPFAGQDVMNVLSLLITGQPYNFATYWKAVSNFDGFNRDPQSHQDAAYSYYASLKTDLSRNNITWGNFIPYKNLMMDEQSFAQQINGQIRAVNRNKDLDSKLQALAEAQRQINVFSNAVIIDPSNQSKFSQDKLKAETQVNQLTQEINSIINDLQKSDQSFSAGALGPNGDPSFDPGTYDTATNPKQALSDAKQRRALRRQLNYLTRRMSYNVRANEDKNLFIVDDSYDKDYDIIAYEESLGDIKLYNNEFQSVKDKITVTADLLNLEVFADTQGHIRVRSPQYNRMPSSVFYRMMYLKKAYGIQIFPQFLEDLFQGQISNLTQRLEVLENQIRLDCAVLGFNTDIDCVGFILNGKNASSSTTANSTSSVSLSGDGDFGFISNEGTPGNWSFKITDMASLLQAANPNSNGNLAQSLTAQATSTKQLFNNTERYQVVSDALTTNSVAQGGAILDNTFAISNNPRIDAIIQAIKTETGQQIPKDYFLVSTSLVDNGVNIPAGQSIDIFKVTTDLSNYIRERQKVLKLLYGAIKNSQEATSLDRDTNVSNNLLTPGIYGNSEIPEMFEHMIEDETYDDYGPGSGSRYIIKRAQIRSIQMAETSPDFTYIEVHGQLDPLLPNTILPGELNSFPQSGNGLTSAAAVDYDLWRKYGFRQQNPINVPFLKDPVNQCAPYASMILSRARKNILRGTVTISGNEYMQPGEVVFLQDRQMLFYVTSVKHSFTFGSGFTTILDLSYGHTPGEYIPTTLDVIGKMLYSNRDLATTSIQRQSSAFNENNMGVIITDPSALNGSPMVATGNLNSSPINSYTASNGNTINNILYQAAYMINANATKGNTIQANVELRIYCDNSSPINNTLQIFAGSVQNILTKPGGPIQGYNTNTGSTPPSLPPSNVSIVVVNLDDPNSNNSPSQKALDMARNLVGKNSTSGGGANPPDNTPNTANTASSTNNSQAQVRISLYTYIVDCWLTFTPVTSNVAKANG